MHVRRIQVCHVGALMGTEVRVYGPIALDVELEAACVEAADRFWTDHVLTQTPPAVDGSDGAKRMISRLFPQNRLPAHKASHEEELIALAYFEAKRVHDQAEEEMDRAKHQLQMRIAERDGLLGDGWRVFFKERAAVEIPATTRKAYRHFDMRPIGQKRDKT
jgi:predicted phage-related endonuclease